MIFRRFPVFHFVSNQKGHRGKEFNKKIAFLEAPFTVSEAIPGKSQVSSFS